MSAEPAPAPRQASQVSSLLVIAAHLRARPGGSFRDVALGLDAGTNDISRNTALRLRGALLAGRSRMQPGFPTRDVQTHAVIGEALEVHRELGCGFLEPAYQEALALEMAEREIPFDHEVTLRVRFKGRVLHSTYRVDFVCFGELLVEVKALPQIGGIEQAQMINYLKASRMERGLILNFGAQSLQCKRVTLFQQEKRGLAKTI